MGTIVSNRSQYNSANLSGGVITQSTSRVRHIAARAITSLQLTYLNGSGETDNGTGTVTVKFAVEYNGTTTPCYIAASRTASVATGASVTTDALSIAIPLGATFYVRTHVSVASGQQWARPFLVRSAWGEGSIDGSDVCDATGTVTGSASSAVTSAICVHGNASGEVPGVLIEGDSIAGGASDQETGYGQLGYLARALNRTPDGVGIPFANIAYPGEKINGFVDVTHGLLRKALPSTVTFRDVIVPYGINDLTALGRTAAQIQTDLATEYARLSALGLRVWGVTLTPSTTSTDSWATTTNQTPRTGCGVGGHRETLNTWLRTIPSPLTGIIDVADAVESARNSSFWKVNGVAYYATTDGTHPTSAMSILMAAVVPVSRLAAASSTVQVLA